MKFCFTHITVGLLAAVMPAATSFAQKQAPQAATTVLLVHGAFADSSGWSQVTSLLEAKKLHVVTVDIPLTSFADDISATKKAIAAQTGPVLLVGHSYGGSVITETGDDPKVVGLVYVAAFAPDAGQAAGGLGQQFPKPPGLAELRPGPEGFLHLTDDGINQDFGPDLTAAQRQVLVATQLPLAAMSLGTKQTIAAWKTKPSWYIVATNDRMINPDNERNMAKTIGATTIELPSSHVVMISHPKETAAFIAKAAAAR